MVNSIFYPLATVAEITVRYQFTQLAPLLWSEGRSVTSAFTMLLYPELTAFPGMVSFAVTHSNRSHGNSRLFALNRLNREAEAFAWDTAGCCKRLCLQNLRAVEHALRQRPGIAGPDSDEEFLVVSSLNTGGIMLTRFSAGYCCGPFTKSDDARRRPITSQVPQLQFGFRGAIATIGRDRTPSSARNEPSLSSGGPSWNDEALGGYVVSDPKCSPPRLSGTRVGRTTRQALDLRPRFRRHMSG